MLKKSRQTKNKSKKSKFELNVPFYRVLAFILKIFAKYYKGLFVAYALLQTYLFLMPLFVRSVEGKLFDLTTSFLKSGSGASILYSWSFMLPFILLIGLYFVNRVINIIATYVDQQIDLKRPIFQDELVGNKLAELDPQIFEDSDFLTLNVRVRSNLWKVMNVVYWILFGILGSLTAITSAFILGHYDLRFLVLTFLALIPSIIVELRFGERVWGIWGSTSHEKIKYNDYARAALPWNAESFTETKVFGYAKYLLRRAIDINQKFIARLSKNATDRLKTSIVYAVPEYVFLGGAAFLMFYDASVGLLSVGQLYFVFNLLFQFKSSISYVALYVTKIKSNSSLYKDFYRYMHIKPAIQSGNKKMILKQPPEIEFKNVWFKYPDTNKWVFRNLNLKIQADEDIALVGKNGAGKTTLLKLLLRIYDPTKGDILINGVNLKDLELQSYYRYVAMLGQNFNKPNIYVKENIYIGDTSKRLNMDRVIDSAKKADIHKSIMKLPRKYNTFLHRGIPGGGMLSGGEWQKLAIARTFYREARLLILDEPTSAVDALAEEKIFDNIFKYAEGKTVIIVSHRFSTVKKAKRIIVIDKGKIIEQGTHKQLMAQKGLYAKMYKAQVK